MLSWAEYVELFESEAKSLGYDSQYVGRCLQYAARLFQRRLPIIYDQEHLALLVGYDISYLRRASNQSKKFYREFKIPKASGGERTIHEPLPSLKEIQRWILDNVLVAVEPSRFAKAYQHGLSVRDNARFHRKQPAVVRLDVRDFFPSIGIRRVFALFRQMGYARGVAWMLARLCTHLGALPQGAPTSAALSNLVCVRLDRRLAGYCKKRKVRFTRYADDMTFSGAINVGDLHWFAARVLTEEGFTLNESKTSVMLAHQRQLVTGVVVNRAMQAPRATRRLLRQVCHYVETFGLDSHMLHIGEERARYVEHVLGVANHILFINPADRDALRARSVMRTYVGAPAPGDGPGSKEE